VFYVSFTFIISSLKFH